MQRHKHLYGIGQVTIERKETDWGRKRARERFMEKSDKFGLSGIQD